MEKCVVKGPVVLWKSSIRFEEKFLYEVGQTLQQVAETVCEILHPWRYSEINWTQL